MSESDPRIEVMELHEEFVQNIERGSARIRTLSVITMAVALLLLASYFSQLIDPFITRTRFVVVDLLDPVLLTLEVLLIAITFIWLYMGAMNYLFSKRMSSAIKIARTKEKEIEDRIRKGMTT
jgi:hypothetical protein